MYITHRQHRSFILQITFHTLLNFQASVHLETEQLHLGTLVNCHASDFKTSAHFKAAS